VDEAILFLDGSEVMGRFRFFCAEGMVKKEDIMRLCWTGNSGRGMYEEDEVKNYFLILPGGERIRLALGKSHVQLLKDNVLGNLEIEKKGSIVRFYPSVLS